jgi:hypothetical protein
VLAARQVSHSRAGRDLFGSGFHVVLAARQVSHSRAGRDLFGSGFHAAALVVLEIH